MKGYLDMKAKGTFASERRVRESLSRVAPLYHYHRQRGTERQINPHPYTAEYHGHKLHMVQVKQHGNEKRKSKFKIHFSTSHENIR